MPLVAQASSVSFWFIGNTSSRFDSGTAACKSLTSAAEFIQETSTVGRCMLNTSFLAQTTRTTIDCPNGNSGLFCNTSCEPPKILAGGQCITPQTCIGDQVLNPLTGSCEVTCAPPKVLNALTQICEVPIPECPDGASWDFDSNKCAYPQDDACGSIGASWSQEAQSCQCPAGKTLSQSLSGMSCLDIADGDCNTTSPDFSGYLSGKPICAGRNRCPNGGKPGFAGSGDNMHPVCVGGDDPDCVGGTSGYFNGKKTCIMPPDNDPRCGPGFTSGYVGTGADMQHTCVPKDHLPDTCPPGQYSWNSGTGSFACVYSDGKPPAKDEAGNPVKPGKVTGEICCSKPEPGDGGSGGEGGGDEEGQDINLDFSEFFVDAPNDNYSKDMDEFGQSKLDGLNVDALAGEFGGQDGAFDDRQKLDAISNFVKTHTIGNSTACSGTLPFMGYTVSCEKFSNYNRIIGWLISLTTMFYIYGVVMRKSESGY